MQDKEESADEEPFYKSKHYYSLKEANFDLTFSFGAKDKASALAKLAGKTMFNVGLFAGKAGLEVVKNIPNIAASMVESSLKANADKMTDEQKEKLSTYVNENKGKKLF